MILSLIAAPWLRYALVGLAVTALLGLVLGVTYQKGYRASELKWKLKWAQLEGAQAQYATAQAVRINHALANKHRSQATIAGKMSEIVIPNTATCADPEWLRVHNDAVRTANGAR